jgi:hypothetical protein
VTWASAPQPTRVRAALENTFDYEARALGVGQRELLERNVDGGGTLLAVRGGLPLRE